MIEILKDIAALRSFIAVQRKAGRTIGFVPTMGALHEGHLQLVKTALQKTDVVIASVFVNPTQFGPNEDYAAYPRDEAGDAAKLESAGAAAVFMPSVEVMYPKGAMTSVHVAGLTDVLCGPKRPGHFDGVATIVTKLLNLVTPDAAFFGEKDFQQLQVIKKLAADLNMNVDIVGVPIVRDENGLALSSRNAYLSADEYQAAIKLNKILFKAANDVAGGAAVMEALGKAKQEIITAGFQSIDYLDIRTNQTLEEVKMYDNHTPARVLVAAKIGKTRLLDNVPVEQTR